MCKEDDTDINNKRLRFLRKIKNLTNADYNANNLKCLLLDKISVLLI